mgnify:CR=1 FL=1
MQFCKLSICFLLFGILIIIPSCYYDNEEDQYGADDTPCDTTAIKYSVHISSTLQDNCYSCHSTGNNISGLLLDSYNRVKVVANNGILLGTVKHAPGFSPMPQGGGKLPDCEIAALEAWVNAGALNN